MSIILLENDKKIKNLFNIIFGTINLNNNKIKMLLSTDEIRTNDMLDEIHKVLNNQYKPNEVNNIYINHGIITNRNNPNFSILSCKNSLSRSLEQASFFNNSNVQNNVQDNLSIIHNNITTGYLSNYDTGYLSNYDTSYESIPKSIPDTVSNTVYESIPESIPESVPETKVLPINTNQKQINNNFNDLLVNNKPIIENFNDTNTYDLMNNQEVANQYYLNKEDLNNKLASLENQIADIKSKSDIECESKINNVKSDLNNQITNIKNKSKESIDNYIKLLTDILLKNQVITQNEVTNMNKNLSSGMIDFNTVINYLENKKKLAKNLTINYNFDNIYLHKWNTPLPRPPICISENPIKVKQIEEYSTNYAPNM